MCQQLCFRVNNLKEASVARVSNFVSFACWGKLFMG